MKKHKDEKYLVPMSDVHKAEVPTMLDKAKLNYKIATFYCTVSRNLKDVINIEDYDLVVLFTPQGISSLKENFPDYLQGEHLIGAFGEQTCNAVVEAGYRLDIKAPTPQTPSMTAAIEAYLKNNK